MRSKTAGAAFVLALAMALGAAAAPPRARQAERIAAAEKLVSALGSELHLEGGDSFTARAGFTNLQGQTIVRLQHRHLGARVWGSEAIAHLLPDGSVRVLREGLLHGVERSAGVALSREPFLSAEGAIAATLKRLAPRGGLRSPATAERVIFPARFVGGVATAIDPATGIARIDRARHVYARPAAPFVWAYQVHVSLDNPLDGPHELDCLIDGNTGNLLRVVEQLAFAHEQASPVATAELGQGNGLYAGPVQVPAAQMVDGTYSLYDPSRGTAPNPALAQFGDDGSGWSPAGLQTWYMAHDASGNPTGETFLYQENPANVWGDGLPFTSYGDENGTNGQSVGVDVQVGMARAWDFFEVIFGRDGPDGNGTGVYAEVLGTALYGATDTAYWNPITNMMWLGAGTYPANRTGFSSLSEPDLVAHELVHGVIYSTAQFTSGAGFEDSGLNEGTAAFFAQMVTAWSSRPAGAPDTVIPDTGATWTVGAAVNQGTPLFNLQHPSKDRRSPDGYFDGIKYMDGHYSAGPLMRALYFLADGASSDPSSEAYSIYLPAGMAGIGSDAAARIWFKTVTERLAGASTGTVTFAEARSQAVAAALDLYPTDPSKALAVESAFAAVNVGDPHGAPPHTVVLFDDWRHGDYIEEQHPFDSNRQYFPMNATVIPRVSVLNNADTRVTWAVGGPSMFNGASQGVVAGGTITADGRWQLPNETAWHSFTATSKADPRQLAEGRAFLINTDTDMDGELDMLDMGGIAFSWYLSAALDPADSVFLAPWVDDGDVSAFVDAVKGAWPIR